MNFIIKVKYGGLGDHLFYSHLPRIAKQLGFKQVFVSRKSDWRNLEYQKYLWKTNPHVDGFTDEDAPYSEGFAVPSDMNLLDKIMLTRDLDDGKRWHEPEIYFKPNVDTSLNKKVVFDPNYIANAGDGIDSAKLVDLLRGLEVTTLLQRRDRGLVIEGFEEITTGGSFERYCSIIASCKKFVCLASGGATLAAAMGIPVLVIVGPNVNKIFLHSKTHKYIPFDRAKEVIRSYQEHSIVSTNLSVFIFSKDRPLFLKTYLVSLRKSHLSIVVLYLASSSEYLEAYENLVSEFPTVRFVCQNMHPDVKSFLLSWLRESTDIVMVTVDDNACCGEIETDAIVKTMVDSEIFGFTLRLAPGICRTQDGKVASSTPQGAENVIVYEPSKYQCPWDYVWEMSSTFYRKSDMRRVIESANIRNPNDLEIAGLQIFNAQTAKKMACFSYAPLTNIFVDSWASPQCVAEKVDNETALRLYREDQEIDIERTFAERDATGVTHVKKLFLKTNKLMNSAIVVIPTRNTEKWTENCIVSVLSQTYSDIGVVFVDDCSDDTTFDVASKLLAERKCVSLIRRTKRYFSLANIDFAIREHCTNPESVIFLLDGDDWLSCPTAIAEMMEQHKTADVVWSKYRNTDGFACCCGPLTSNDIRSHPWVTSHLRSFKKFLFDAIKTNDFTDENGEFYRMTGDQAVMLPIIEQVPPERRKFYDKELYVYNRDNPTNDDKISRAEQKRCEDRIRRQKPYSFHPQCLKEDQSKIPSVSSISVVISSYNQLNTLKLTLDSFNFQSFQPKEVIIADDGSTDGTIEWLESIGHDRYLFPVLYTTRKHQGYRLASVNTEAARHASGTRILFTNADVVHCSVSLKQHMALDENILGAGIIKSLGRDGASEVNTATIADFSKVLQLMEKFPAGRTNLVYKQYNPDVCFAVVWGGNFSISRKMLEKIGWFDEGFIGWGAEDADIARRCVSNGGHVIHVNDSLAIHLDHILRTYSYRQLGCHRFSSK